MWNIKNIEKQDTKVSPFTLTYSIEGVVVIKKHELSIDNGVTYKEITPVGNTTGFSINIDITSEQMNCYIRCTDSEGNSQTSNPFIIQKKAEKIKPTVKNVKVLNTNQNGTYTFTYEVVSSLDLLSHSLSIDEGEYKNIKPTLQDNTFTYIGSNMKNGTHLCSLLVTDIESDKSDPILFQVIIPELPNTPPVIEGITVEETNSKGRYKISYTATDINKKDLITHKIKIDNNDFVEIKPISINNKYTYVGFNLGVGSHTAIIQISDGKNIVETEPFTITIEAETTESIKEKLSTIKSEYDTSYTSLIDTINKVISDGKVVEGYDISAGIILIDEAYKVYTEKSVALKGISQKAIDIIGSKKTNDSKENLEQEIGDLTNALGSLDQSMNDVFKDGILDETEKLTIRQQLQALSLEKVDVDNQYNSILSKFNQTDLKFAEDGVIPPDFTGEKLDSYPDKKWYLDLYNNFKKSYEDYSTKYSNLILVIDYILKKETILDDTDKEKKDKALNEYILAIGEYSKQASLAIDGIARNETENNEFVVKTFKAEYVRTNKENSAKLTELTQTTNGLNEKVSEFKQTADKIQTQVTQNTNGLATQSSKITQLAHQITSKVNYGEFGTMIQQNSYSVTVAVKNGTLVTTDDWGHTVWNGYLACDRLTTPRGHDPIIYLFGNQNSSRCAIDATKQYNEGVGEAIRLKWDNSNYVLVGKNNLSLYSSNYGETSMFKVTERYITYRGDDIVSYNANGKHFNGYQININSIEDNGRGSILMRTSLQGGTTLNIGDSSNKFQQVCALRVWADGGSITSDKKYKENIVFLDENKKSKSLDVNDNYRLLNNVNNKNKITTTDLYNFIKNDLSLCKYNYNKEFLEDAYDENNADTHLGFIAQDLIGTKVEKIMLRNDDGNNLGYNLNSYVSVLAGALQIAINKIETLETEINNIKNGGKQ